MIIDLDASGVGFSLSTKAPAKPEPGDMLTDPSEGVRQVPEEMRPATSDAAEQGLKEKKPMVVHPRLSVFQGLRGAGGPTPALKVFHWLASGRLFDRTHHEPAANPSCFAPG